MRDQRCNPAGRNAAVSRNRRQSPHWSGPGNFWNLRECAFTLQPEVDLRPTVFALSVCANLIEGLKKTPRVGTIGALHMVRPAILAKNTVNQLRLLAGQGFAPWIETDQGNDFLHKEQREAKINHANISDIVLTIRRPVGQIRTGSASGFQVSQLKSSAPPTRVVVPGARSHWCAARTGASL